MNGSDTAVYYLAPERDMTLETKIVDAITGVVPICLLFSRTDARFGRSFAMKQTLRDELAICKARNAVVVWDEYLKDKLSLKEAIRQYESELCQHFGRIMIHRFAKANFLENSLCEWHLIFDCGMDLIVGEVSILKNSYAKEV